MQIFPGKLAPQEQASWHHLVKGIPKTEYYEHQLGSGAGLGLFGHCYVSDVSLTD